MSEESPTRDQMPQLSLAPEGTTFASPAQGSYEVAVTGAIDAAPQLGRPRKKRSGINEQTRGEKGAASTSSPAMGRTGPQSPTVRLAAQTARKSSLRNVVRRIFGRRPRSTEVKDHKLEQPTQTTVKHGHSPSDPGVLNIPSEPVSESTRLREAHSHRSFSLPAKTHSPVVSARPLNAVEFPQSARLKPLDLENPFHVRGKRRERRATLSSLVLDELAAETISRVLKESDPAGRESDVAQGDTGDGQHDIGLAITTPTHRQNRRSRSVDDMRNMISSLDPARPRGEEIEFWRRSFAASILRHSPVEDHRVSPEDDYSSAIEDLAAPDSIVRDEHFSTPNPQKLDLDGEGRFLARSDTPVDFEGNLLARVMRLESNWARQESRNEPTRSHRSSTAVPKGSGRSGLRLSESISQEYAALFSIINQERAARLQLEEQVRELQHSLSEMAYQLSRPLLARRSIPSQQVRDGARSTLYDASIGTHYDHVPHLPSYSGTAAQRLTSRFSLSESLTDSEAARLRASREIGVAELDTNGIQQTEIDLSMPAAVSSTRFSALEGEMF